MGKQQKKFSNIKFLVMSVALVLLIIASPVFAQPKAKVMERPTPPPFEYVEGEVLVKYKNSHKPFEVVKVANVLRAVEAMSKNPNVEYVEPNYVMTAFMIPNDEYYTKYQWNFHTFDSAGGVGAEVAWDSTRGAIITEDGVKKGVVVAVVDTGVAKGSDLDGTCFVPGYDYVNGDNDATDDQGHGTHVAGTIAQTTNNEIGVAGLAHEACIMPVKVLGADGSGTVDGVASGIKFAVDSGAKVINLSLGGPASQALYDAVKYAYVNGVTVVAATGNDNASVSYPAAYDEYVIAVGATRKNGVRAPYSNYGASIDVVAPGGYFEYKRVRGQMVLVSYDEGILQQTLVSGTPDQFDYYFYSGTSMATPHVSAAAAMVLAHGNATTPEEVRMALESTARDLGEVGWDQYYGHGLLDVPAALAWTSAGGGGGDVEEPPVIEPPATEPTPIDLSVTGSKVRAVMTAYLNWTGASGDNVDVYRNNSKISSTLNDGTYTDTIGKGGGTFTYKVCEAGDVSRCSTEQTISF